MTPRSLSTSSRLIVAEVTDRRDRTKLFGSLDTLEFLKRGGRVGNARALLGSMLSIKPVVEVRDGVVEEAGKVRTRSKALRVLADHVRAQPVENLAVLHGNAPDLDEFLAGYASLARPVELPESSPTRIIVDVIEERGFGG